MSEPTRRTGATARDEEAIGHLARKDPRGLLILLEDHGPRVKWWLRTEFRGALDDSGIQEALNEAAHRVWKSFATFDPTKGSLRSWFYVICRNAALKILRRETAQGTVQLADWSAVTDQRAEVGAVELDPVEPIRPTESPQVRALREVVDRLPRLMRAVVEADLASPKGVADADELARDLNSSRSAIYNARSKARRKIETALRDRYLFQEPPSAEAGGEEMSG